MVVEAVGVSEEMLGNSGVSKKMVGVCDKLGFHIIKTYKHLFTPQGISLVFILKESHLAIHTWPEKGYFHMDAVTCSKEDVKIMRLVEELVLQFKPRSTRVLRLKY
ncbi:MAG: S-adenosylmethionine decarboxylase [Patescibacteria group bacterium]